MTQPSADDVQAQPPSSQPVDRIRVGLDDRSYDVVVGLGLLATAGAAMRPLLRRRRVVVITDEVVAALYLPALTASLEAAGIASASIVLPSGEQTKDFPHLQDLCERALDLRIERGTMLVALGGGVIGDITGFAAGILLRGLDFIQVPTTLLAQVDSSVGGKTGINTRQGKNLVGLFHQPRLVLADVGTLSTLDDRQLRAGYAEVVKYGVIGDASFFAWLEAEGARVLAREPDALRLAVATSCRAKAAVVAADEREAGLRALLNLGHTFGHALEAETGFGEALLHGEAVAIGMVLACALSERLGLLAADGTNRLRRHLESAGLPTGLANLFESSKPADRSLLVASLIAHMRSDKKVRDDRLTFVLVRSIGDAFVRHGVNEEDVSAILSDALGHAADAAPPHARERRQASS